MKQTAVHILLLLTIIAMTAVSARAENSGSRNRAYGFLMMEEPVNPRNIGMGSVGAALGGAGFRYYNPVAPFFSETPYVSAEFGQMPGGVNKGGFETAMLFPEWFAAVGFYSSSINFETRDERGFGSTASSGTTFGAMTVGYMRDKLSIAAGMTFAEDRIWIEEPYSAIALDFGFGYKLMDGKLGLGAALSHYAAWSKGFGDNASSWSDAGLVPKYARFGAAWADTFKSFPYTIAADMVFHDEDGKITIPVGIDVKVLPYINLRLGKRIGWDNEVISFGLGLNVDRIAFDAAFVPVVFVDDYEMKWSMAFTYNMGARRKKTPPDEKTSVSITTPDDIMNLSDAKQAEDSVTVYDDAVVIDTTVVDSTVVDTSIADTSVVDTTVVDTNVVDAAVVDNNVADDSVADNTDVDNTVVDDADDDTETTIIPPQESKLSEEAEETTESQPETESKATENSTEELDAD